MTFNSHSASTGAHASHDRLSIATLAAGDLAGAARDRATALVGACDSCRTLLADVQSISAAVQQLPPMERAPGRDFRLGAVDARRLTRGSRWGRFLWPFVGARSPVIRPLAATLMTLGLAGFILSAQPLLHFGSADTAPMDVAPGPVQSSAMPDKTQSEVLAPMDDETGATPSEAPLAGYAGRGSVNSAGDDKDAAGPAVAVTPSTPGWLSLFASLLSLVTGIGLLLLRRVALRSR